MFPRSMKQLQATANREQLKAIDALSVCVAVQIADETRNLILDAPTQQRIENYWKAQFAALIGNAAREIKRNPYGSSTVSAAAAHAALSNDDIDPDNEYDQVTV